MHAAAVATPAAVGGLETIWDAENFAANVQSHAAHLPNSRGATTYHLLVWFVSHFRRIFAAFFNALSPHFSRACQPLKLAGFPAIPNLPPLLFGPPRRVEGAGGHLFP